MMNSRYYLVVSSLLLCSCRDRLEEENPRESISGCCFAFYAPAGPKCSKPGHETALASRLVLSL